MAAQSSLRAKVEGEAVYAARARLRMSEIDFARLLGDGWSDVRLAAVERGDDLLSDVEVEHLQRVAGARVRVVGLD